MSTARNAPCPCGSGKKYKRCCLSREGRAPAAVSTDDIRQQLELIQKLLQIGDLERADKALQPLLQGARVPADALVLASSVAMRRKDYAQACAFMERVVASYPDDPNYLYNYATALSICGRKREAVDLFLKVLAVDPSKRLAYANLGHTLRDLGRSAEAIDCYCRAFDQGGIDPATMSQILLSMHLFVQTEHEQLFAMHRQLGERIARTHPRLELPPRSPRDNGKLRLGYLSPRFSREIVGYFFKPLFDHHDRSRFEIYLYNLTPREDDLTRYFESRADKWMDLGDLDEAGIAARIAADEVDILVDLAGHAPENRIGVMARRPAPMQVSLLDYFDTTGLDAVDYYVTDRFSTPAQSEQRFTEALLYLDRPRLVYEAPPYAPPVAVTTSPSEPLVFGSFNRHQKIVPQVVETWAQLLRAVPGSRLVLKGGPFMQADIQRQFLERFTAAGLEPERIEFRDQSPHADLLAEYAGIDIALDTFPYNGGLTTCEAMWMGTPVLTLLGERVISRQTAGMLHAVGIPEFIASDADDFTRIGASWAQRREELRELRLGLREKMAASALTDAAGYARDLEEQLLREWQLRAQNHQEVAIP